MLLASGGSTGLSVEGIAGRVLLILTEVITLLVWALLFAAMTIAVLAFDYGNHLSVHLTIYEFLLCGRLYCSVIFDCSVVF